MARIIFKAYFSVKKNKEIINSEVELQENLLTMNFQRLISGKGSSSLYGLTLVLLHSLKITTFPFSYLESQRKKDGQLENQ